VNMPTFVTALTDRLRPPDAADVGPSVLRPQPDGVPAAPVLADRIDADFVTLGSARTVRAGEPNEDADESRPLDVERELEAAHAEIQYEISKWSAWVDSLVAARVPVLRDQARDLGRRAGEARSRCDQLWQQRRRVEDEMAVNEASSFLTGLAMAAAAIALVLALFEVPLLEPIITEVTNLSENDGMRWIGAFLVVGVQALVAYGAAVAAKEWQQSRAALRTRRWMLCLAVGSGVATLALAVGIVAMRYAQYHADTTNPDEAGGVLALAVGLQAALAACAVLAGWFGHSPLARELAGLVEKTVEADAELSAIDAATQATEASADEIEAFVADLPAWLVHHRDGVRQQAVQVDHALRDRIKELLVPAPEGEVRIWKLDRLPSPSFPIPVVDLELGDHDLLGDESQMSLF